MQAPEHHKASRRTPLTKEELEAVIAFKKRKAELQFLQLKNSLSYKLRNLFLVVCFFVFCEIIVCYFGPCQHTIHYTKYVSGFYSAEYDKEKGPLLKYIEAICVDDGYFRLLVDDYRRVPPKHLQLDVCTDFIMNCELKAGMEGMEGNYRLFRANPVLLLSVFCSVILLFGIYHNYNQQDYTLWGLTVLCGMTLIYLICV